MTLPMSPGRRVLVGWCVPLSLLVIGYGAWGLVNVVGLTRYTDAVTVSPQVQAVSVDAHGGSVRLEPSPDSKVHVTAKGLYSMVAPTLGTASTSTGVTITGGCRHFAVITCNENLVIEVPASFRVTARSGGGDIDEYGLGGDLNLSSSGGDVSTDGAAGTLVISTGGGDVHASNVAAADVTASSSGGDLSLAFAVVPSTVAADSSGGDVDIRLPGTAAYDVTADSAGGDVSDQVDQDSTSPHVIEARSSGGDVSVRPSS